MIAHKYSQIHAQGIQIAPKRTEAVAVVTMTTTFVCTVMISKETMIPCTPPVRIDAQVHTI